jgi:hypothetical protein
MLEAIGLQHRTAYRCSRECPGLKAKPSATIFRGMNAPAPSGGTKTAKAITLSAWSSVGKFSCVGPRKPSGERGDFDAGAAKSSGLRARAGGRQKGAEHGWGLAGGEGRALFPAQAGLVRYSVGVPPARVAKAEGVDLWVMKLRQDAGPLIGRTLPAASN